MSLTNKGSNKVVASGNKKKRWGGALPGVDADDLSTVAQTPIIDSSGNVSQVVAFTGANTHTGLESFSNAAGLKADIVTPVTSGGGTVLYSPAAEITTATASANLKSGGQYLLSKVDGQVITLPTVTATGVGTVLEFTLGLDTTSTATGYSFLTSPTSVTLVGMLNTFTATGASGAMNVASGVNNRLTLATGANAGLTGGNVKFTAVSTSKWVVSGSVRGSGTLVQTLFTTI
jgi:hypothetical protein